MGQNCSVYRITTRWMVILSNYCRGFRRCGNNSLRQTCADASPTLRIHILSIKSVFSPASPLVLTLSLRVTIDPNGSTNLPNPRRCTRSRANVYNKGSAIKLCMGPNCSASLAAGSRMLNASLLLAYRLSASLNGIVLRWWVPNGRSDCSLCTTRNTPAESTVSTPPFSFSSLLWRWCLRTHQQHQPMMSSTSEPMAPLAILAVSSITRGRVAAKRIRTIDEEKNNVKITVRVQRESAAKEKRGARG